MPIIALVRPISQSIADCQLTHLNRQPIDLERARRQHAEYVTALTNNGCQVLKLPQLDDCPDAVFVEDTAIVLPEVAIITRPGAVSRQPETSSMATALQQFRTLKHIDQPAACIDGGDVVVDDKTIYVGLSSRSNHAAIEQLAELTGPFGYKVKGVALRDCLHLKTAVTRIAPGVFVGNPDWYESSSMPGQHIEVDPQEPFGANTVELDGVLLRAKEHPASNQRIADFGGNIVTVAADELAKAEGAVTCCSVLIHG